MLSTDYTQSAAAILTSLINYDNGTTLQPSQLSFGTPTPILSSQNAGATQVIASAAQGSPYTGSVSLTYNRVDLRTVPGNRSILFLLGSAQNISDLLPQINAAYRINLSAGDIVDGPLPGLTGTPVNGVYPAQTLAFNLVMNPNNLVFFNSVTLNFTNSTAIPLSSVITVTSLNGLVYTQPS